MKVFRFGLVVMAVGLMTFGLIGTAAAFHSGGVAECGGCHSMHSATSTDGNFLVMSDPSSTCLNCHQHAGDTGPSGYHISTDPGDMPVGTPPLQMTPGGDFGWLKKDYTFTVRGTTSTEYGQTHGHNIVATDFGYVADTTNTTAPGGGALSAGDLKCISCHDPHSKNRRLIDNSIAGQTAGVPITGSGSYQNSGVPLATEAKGVYRLLGGAGYTKDGVTFSGTPAAVAPSSYNRSESTTQTRVAYGNPVTNGSGYIKWGDWCKTCHPAMHSESGTQNVHPTDSGLSDKAGIYVDYVKSGDMGGQTNSYLSLVPYIETETDYTALAAHAVTTDAPFDPTGTDQVSCLSCHRAHASGWEYMLRWNMENEFVTYDGVWPGTDSTPTRPQNHRGRTSDETSAAYYDKPATYFATYQRALCNKCHAQD